MIKQIYIGPAGSGKTFSILQKFTDQNKILFFINTDNGIPPSMRGQNVLLINGTLTLEEFKNCLIEVNNSNGICVIDSFESLILYRSVPDMYKVIELINSYDNDVIITLKKKELLALFPQFNIKYFKGQ